MNFIQKYNLTKQLSRFAKRKKEEEVQVCSLERANSVCIFHTFESQEMMEQVIKSASSLKRNKTNVAICFLIPKKKKVLMPDSAGVCFVLEKDFDLKGSLRKEKLLSLQKQSFDMLIDLDKEPSLFSLYLTGKIKAKFRIGRCENAKKYYNVILYSSNENYTMEDYFQSIDRYTKKMVRG
jgi:hypothetical protein